MPYLEIARIDHWFKCVFMILGVVVAVFYEPERLSWSSALSLAFALLAANLVASSNYVINEVLDAPFDRVHPEKRHRPVAAGRVDVRIAVVEWLALAAVGGGIGVHLGVAFSAALALLWGMGLLYNLPPIRLKEVPYADVLTESINNPIRLLLGWFALIPDRFPPLSLLLAYWMAGAYFMAIKRLAELRHLGDPVIAARYRRSFAHYDESRLLVSILFYATACGLLSGIFLVRARLELVLFVPLAASFLAYYLRLGLAPDSLTQRPEALYRDRGLVVLATVCLLAFVALLFVEIPWLYDVFDVSPDSVERLWRIERPASTSSPA